MSFLSKLSVGQWVAVFCILIAALLELINVLMDKDFNGWIAFLIIGAIIYIADMLSNLDKSR